MDGTLDTGPAAPASGGMRTRARRRILILPNHDAKLPPTGAQFVAAGQLCTATVPEESCDFARQRGVMRGHQSP